MASKAAPADRKYKTPLLKFITLLTLFYPQLKTVLIRLFRNVKNLNKLNERELEMGLAGSGSSWHRKYRDSAWIFVGGLPYDLTEGDVVCVFSQ